MKRIKLILFITVLCGVLATSAGADRYFDKGEEESMHLPVIMYHSILKNPSAQGKYVLSPEKLEEDFLYLKEHGYTSIKLSELISYVYMGANLPENPVLITFDDAHVNNITYALPLLEKYDMYAVISVVGRFTDVFSENPDHNPSYAYFSWDEISEVVKGGRIEIGNHSYNMHSVDSRRGTMRKKGESAEDYSRIFTEDVTRLQDSIMEKCGFKPQVFTYPYGLISNESVPLVKEMGFLASFSCAEVINEITRDPECLYLLGRFNRQSGISTQAFMKKMKID